MKKLLLLAFCLIPSLAFAQGPSGPPQLISGGNPVIGCGASTYLQNNSGTLGCSSVTVPVGANPTAVIGLAAVNGSALTFMRSDAAPTLDQTAAWVFSGLGATTISANGALSAPAFSGTGTWIAAGGTGTTTKPYFLIEPAGTSSTTWPTAGTGLGINAATGFAGSLLRLSVAGVSQHNFAANGTYAATSTISSNANIQAGTNLLAARQFQPDISWCVIRLDIISSSGCYRAIRRPRCCLRRSSAVPPRPEQHRSCHHRPRLHDPGQQRNHGWRKSYFTNGSNYNLRHRTANQTNRAIGITHILYHRRSLAERRQRECDDEHGGCDCNCSSQLCSG